MSLICCGGQDGKQEEVARAQERLCVCVRVKVCVLVCVCVEVTGQPWESSLRAHLPVFYRQSLSLAWNMSNRLAQLAREPSRSCLPTIGTTNISHHWDCKHVPPYLVLSK